MRHSLSRTVQSNLVFLARAAIGVILHILLIGCAAAPNPGSFAKQTAELSETAQRIGAATEMQLASAGLESAPSDFAQAWKARERAWQAAIEYSRSLEATFAQARSAQPESLSHSLQLLASALGVGGTIDAVGVPATGVLGATADTIAFIHAQIALIAASRDLEQALTRAQPVVDRLARLILADTVDLESIVRAGASLRRLELAAEFNDALAFSASLEQRRNELRRVSYTELTPSDLNELERIGQFRAALATELEPYFSRLAAINAHESGSLDAIGAFGAGIEAWAASHQRLVAAARAENSFEPATASGAIADPRAIADHRSNR